MTAMDLTRRDFLVGASACAAALCGGCIITNKAPTFDADPDGTLPVPEALAVPGAQIKVRMPGIPEEVLVWRDGKGLGAASVVCTHRGCEVGFNADQGTLDCPCHGSRFNPDGSVLQGPAKRPLQSYRVTEEGGRLRIRKA